MKTEDAQNRLAAALSQTAEEDHATPVIEAYAKTAVLDRSPEVHHVGLLEAHGAPWAYVLWEPGVELFRVRRVEPEGAVEIERRTLGPLSGCDVTEVITVRPGVESSAVLAVAHPALGRPLVIERSAEDPREEAVQLLRAWSRAR